MSRQKEFARTGKGILCCVLRDSIDETKKRCSACSVWSRIDKQGSFCAICWPYRVTQGPVVRVQFLYAGWVIVAREAALGTSQLALRLLLFLMGIQGLLPQLKSVTARANVSKYRGKRAAVDAYVLLHRGAYTCAREICEGKPTDR
jgi:hypothetical protein